MADLRGDATPSAPYHSLNLRRFVTSILRPRFPPEYQLHGKRSLVRTYGSFVQELALSGGRYADHVHVLPTLYVAGAEPWVEGIHQGVCLDALDRPKWIFRDVALDGALADRIVALLAGTPVSFQDPLSEATACASLAFMTQRKVTEVPAFFLAFFLMTLGKDNVQRPVLASRRFPFFRRDTGVENASSRLNEARGLFASRNRRLIHDWQRTTAARFEELSARLGTPDCVALSRREAEEHAAKLHLPALRWPT
jgi:hypothetical protein